MVPLAPWSSGFTARGGRNVRGGSPRCSTGESWQSSPNAPTCSSRERGSTTSASMCRGRLLELPAAFWGDLLGARATALAGDGPAGVDAQNQGGLEALGAQRRGDHAKVLCARRVQRRGALWGEVERHGRRPRRRKAFLKPR